MTDDGRQNATSDAPAGDAILRSPDSADRPELFFALVGPIGTDLGEVCDALEHELSHFKYGTKTIKLSERLHSLKPYEGSDGFAERFDAKKARPRVTMQNNSHRALEDMLCANLDSSLKALEWL